jgi:hypothetical protein
MGCQIAGSASTSQSPAPSIEPVLTRGLLPGEIVALRGENLGTEPGQADLAGQSLHLVEWTDTRIRLRIPRDAKPGEAPLTIRTANGSSEVSLRVVDPFFAPRVQEIPCAQERRCSLYLPPAYDTDPNRRFPVVYHFQRNATTHRDVAQIVDFAAVAEPYEFIVVFDWQILDDDQPLELVKEIDEAYRTIPRPEARGIWLSSASGGRGLRIASEHPEVFSAVDASAACIGQFDPEKARALRIRIDIGDEDTTCGDQTTQAHQLLEQAGVPHIFDIFPGNHNQLTVFSPPVIRSVLEFFRGALVGSSASL